MKSGIVLALLLGLMSLGAPPTGYQVTKKIPLPGAGGWDYLTVDENARRVYLSHATQVVVLDADSLEVVGVISGLAGVHGIAIAPEFGRGFITAGQTDSVAVFEVKTLKKLAEVKVDKKPDAIVYDPLTRRVFAMNGDSQTSTVINAADNKVLGTISLGGGPEFAIADSKGNVFVNVEDKSELLRIDATTLQVRNRWPVAPCEAPSSMAFDVLNNRLFLGCRSRVMAVVNAESGKVLGTYPIGDKVDATVFDPASKVVFSSTGDGHVYPFHQDSADRYSTLAVISTAQGSKTMAMDRKTQRLFVPAREGSAVVMWVFEKQRINSGESEPAACPFAPARWWNYWSSGICNWSRVLVRPESAPKQRNLCNAPAKVVNPSLRRVLSRQHDSMPRTPRFHNVGRITGRAYPTSAEIRRPGAVFYEARRRLSQIKQLKWKARKQVSESSKSRPA